MSGWDIHPIKWADGREAYFIIFFKMGFPPSKSQLTGFEKDKVVRNRKGKHTIVTCSIEVI